MQQQWYIFMSLTSVRKGRRLNFLFEPQRQKRKNQDCTIAVTDDVCVYIRHYISAGWIHPYYTCINETFCVIKWWVFSATAGGLLPRTSADLLHKDLNSCCSSFASAQTERISKYVFDIFRHDYWEDLRPSPESHYGVWHQSNSRWRVFRCLIAAQLFQRNSGISCCAISADFVVLSQTAYIYLKGWQFNFGDSRM